MSETVIEINNVKKKYKLGEIGGGTLRGDLQSWWARVRKKEDPNLLIGTDLSNIGDEFYALDGISFSVDKGEAIGIIGHNGAGKSTLLKLLSRVTAPTEGEIRIKGRIASMLEVGTGFHPELTGRENIYMNGAILGMSRKEVDSKIEEIIDFSECRQFIDTPVKRYSSGMYVKLAFAVAAHLDAEIMVMDEVLAVGDMKFQKKCLGKMGDEAQGGKTVLYVSHNMSTIRQLCTRCVVLKHGKIIFDGDVNSAINLYLEESQGELKPYYNFDNIARPSNDHGRNLFVHSLRILNKEYPQYKNDEKFEFEVEMSANKDINDLRVYFTLKDYAQNSIGTTESLPFGCIKSGERIKESFSLDISNLVSGTYSFYLDIFSVNDYGAHLSYDHPLEKVCFEVEDVHTGGIGWKQQYFGSVRLNELMII